MRKKKKMFVVLHKEKPVYLAENVKTIWCLIKKSWTEQRC